MGHDAQRDGGLGWEVAEGLDGAGGLAGVVVGGEEGGEGAVGGATTRRMVERECVGMSAAA